MISKDHIEFFLQTRLMIFLFDFQEFLSSSGKQLTENSEILSIKILIKKKTRSYLDYHLEYVIILESCQLFAPVQCSLSPLFFLI
jgi:hypothetical protein